MTHVPRLMKSIPARECRNLRDVLVLGTNADAAEMVAMLMDHPEAGFRVRGVAGDRAVATANGLGHLHLGECDQVPDLLRKHGVTGVIIVVGAMPSSVMSPLVEQLSEDGVHVQVSNGLHGVSHRRFRVTPVAFQSLYYLEPATTRNATVVLKRVGDGVVASLALLLSLPITLVAAVAVKATDRGPVLFRQQRVGQGGQPFGMLKFRSMVVDAEARLADLATDNERVGPLFKLTRDPRVTRVGRFLRATSIDEIPQLINVLKGEMSIVGPRPALPAEVAQFDDRLLERLRMRPGITGLWQVEARDNPHFGAYRRLDLFYVDNWSITLDMVILVATVEQVLSRAFRSLTPRRRHSHAADDPRLGHRT